MPRPAGPAHALAPKTLVAAAVLTLTVLTAAACSQQPPVVNVSGSPTGTAPDHGPDNLPNGITVSGEGKVTGKPDTLTVSFGVSLKRPKVDAAVKDAADRANAVTDAAKANGIEDKDLQTQNYQINPEFIYPPNGGKPIPDGYRVTNTMVVKIRAIDKAGATIDAITQAGGDDVLLQQVGFSLENDDSALAAAREKAFTDARTKAEQFTKLSGRALGKPVAIADVSVVPDVRTLSGAAAKGAFASDQAAAPTPISSGEVSTTVNISVRFEFA